MTNIWKLSGLAVLALALTSCTDIKEQQKKARANFDLPPGCQVFVVGQVNFSDPVYLFRCDGRKTVTSNVRRGGKNGRYVPVFVIEGSVEEDDYV